MKRFIFMAAGLIISVLLVSGMAWAAQGDLEEMKEDDLDRLIDIYCSQTAKDALEYDQLRMLVDHIVTSIEPQAVNLLVECFPCFKEAAEKDELGREIGLYIYYGAGDLDGIEEHEKVEPGSYAYVTVGLEYEEDGKCQFKYMICIDAESIIETDDMDNGVLDLDGQVRIQLDNTFCHELFHAFMYDYNRVGMSGYTDFTPFASVPNELVTEEEEKGLVEETRFPYWFIEGLAGCVGNIYPADLECFEEYHYDPESQMYLDICTEDQLCHMYAHWDHMKGVGEQLYDLEVSPDYVNGGSVDGAVYVSGYMACLYLADLEYQVLKGTGAVTFDENGDVISISSEKLREGLSGVLSRLHRGDTLDEVIKEISGGLYEDTDDFTKRFIKGSYNEEIQDYEGDPESLPFCVGFLNYMNRLDDLDPETHPVGSVLMDDFTSTQPTPIEKDKDAESDFYRFVGENTMVASTVPSEKMRDGGTSYSGRDSFEEVLKSFRTKDDQCAGIHQ